jgi:serine/threonine-protein kinase
MGTVWAARHEMLGRDFAIKFATLPVRAQPEARTRFLREAQNIGKLRHPNVVDVADFGEVEPGGGLYLAMELLEGQSLAERIEQSPLRPREATAIAAEVARGLAAAHAAGIVHRDIKPENIFLARGAHGGVIPKLLDFGISKQRKDETLATIGGQPVGTPAYMSPEQALGEDDIDHRSDVWSLGVVLYEMISGQHPFVAPNYQALLPKIAEEPAAPLAPSVPEPVRAIVEKCLEKRREDRFQDASALLEALERALAAMGEAQPGSLMIERVRVLASLRPPSSESLAPPGAARPSRSSRVRVVGAAAIALLFAAGALLWLRSRPAPTTEAPPPSPSSPGELPSPTTAAAAFPVPPSAAPATAAPLAASPVPTATVLPSADSSARKQRPQGGKTSRTTSVDNPGF